MKPTPGTLAAALLLLIAAPSLLVGRAEPVLDTDGDALKTSVAYHIVPAVTDVAGGTTLGARNVLLCPLSVALASSPAEKGNSVEFVPAYADEADEIQLGKDVNVVPDAPNICVQSPVWKIGFDEVDGRYYVVAGGEIGNPGKETLSNWFSIEEYRGQPAAGVYEIVFCPTVCEICRPVCGAIGVYEQDGRLWLGISDTPFPFVFEKASASELPLSPSLSLYV